MAGEFTKPSSMYVAAIGKIASPSGINQNYAALGKDSLLFFDEDGVFTDGDIGDETEGSIGSLVNNIKIRDGGVIKKYDASGVYIEDVNLGQATESVKGQAELATSAEVLAGTDDYRIITPLKLRTQGKMLIQQVVLVNTTYSDSAATTFPDDDTKPQIGEGTELMSQSFTPIHASSEIEILFDGNIGQNGVTTGVVALFVDSTADCLKSQFGWPGNGNSPQQYKIVHHITNTNTTARTYRIRYAGNAGTMYANGISGGRKGGGSLACTLTINEWL